MESTTRIEMIALAEIPDTFILDISNAVAAYSIGFIRPVKTPKGELPELVGSGTLVKAGNIHAVLTAQHVIAELPSTGHLGLVMLPTLQQFTVDTHGLQYREIARGTSDADGPDIAVIILPHSVSSAIAARKSFYNLDTVRDQMLVNSPEIENGIWFVNGFVDEWTASYPDPDGRRVIKSFYNLTGAGGAANPKIVGDFDYLTVPITYGGKSEIPISFGGMSGGALWQVKIIRNRDGDLEHRKPILSGVVFYQDPTNGNQGSVKCHGRLSIYRVAYEAIIGS